MNVGTGRDSKRLKSSLHFWKTLQLLLSSLKQMTIFSRGDFPRFAELNLKTTSTAIPGNTGGVKRGVAGRAKSAKQGAREHERKGRICVWGVT